MSVAVVHVREVVVAVRHRRMNVFVGVRFRRIVTMLMVFVMRVAMAVAQRFVAMRVGMALADVQPDADRHQRDGGPERQPRCFAQ